MSGNEASSEDDITIPRAAMNKMIKELCPNIRVANEARELILACCTEFIHLLSSEANDTCNNQQKKTISAEHVLMGKSRFSLDALDVMISKKYVTF
jgi:histone H3/H4